MPNRRNRLLISRPGKVHDSPATASIQLCLWGASVLANVSAAAVVDIVERKRKRCDFPDKSVRSLLGRKTATNSCSRNAYSMPCKASIRAEFSCGCGHNLHCHHRRSCPMPSPRHRPLPAVRLSKLRRQAPQGRAPRAAPIACPLPAPRLAHHLLSRTLSGDQIFPLHVYALRGPAAVHVPHHRCPQRALQCPHPC